MSAGVAGWMTKEATSWITTGGSWLDDAEGVKCRTAGAVAGWITLSKTGY